MEKIGLAFINKKFVPLSRASISVMDLAVHRGVGIVEVLRTYNRVPFALAEHLDRLENSIKILGLEKCPSRKYIEKVIALGVKKVRYDAVIKILITGGESHHLVLESSPQLIVIFYLFHPWPAVQYEKGAKLQTVMHSRPISQAKSTDYLMAVLATRDAKAKGFDEALYIDEKKRIFEGTTFNFAIIKGRRLITPIDGILLGVTMERVLKLAKKLGLSVVRRQIKYSELMDADEAITTSTLREVIPVARVDAFWIGSGEPGPYAKKLLALFRSSRDKKLK